MNANTDLTLISIKDRMSRGELTASDANVEMVRAERVRVINSIVPADIRKTLNAAVKAGSLGHMRKEGLKPEVYFHPAFEYLAKGERASRENMANQAIAKVYGWPA